MFGAEIIFVSIIVGIGTKSWWGVLISFVFMFGILSTPWGVVLVFIFSTFWAVFLGKILGSVAAGLLVFIISLAIHLSGLEFYRDLQ